MSVQCVVLRLDAPLMSFGGASSVDNIRTTEKFPARSMLTGLIANAMGWRHQDTDKLHELQSRIVYAARWDVDPVEIEDYQTIGIKTPYIMGAKKADAKKSHWWTFDGKITNINRSDTFIRYKRYLQDGLMTVTVSLSKEDERINLDAIQRCLDMPKRPLFIGRKTCIPSRPLLDPQTPVVMGDNVLDALKSVPVMDKVGRHQDKKKMFYWTNDESVSEGLKDMIDAFDMRNWESQLCMSGKQIRFGVIEQ
ncbi:MAG: type I-E CRISPR-associated protein Cas5/CasD [Methanobacteriota archaeon]|nr:MAG: type I-E CRISPR-associated protein Cas5/CasD [Euryarchaeota archaeon]